MDSCQNADRTSIAHITDLHFGREQPAVVEGLLASLNQLSPQLVVVSGDVTQRARQAQFRQVREFLKRLASPYLIVPGNHDLAAFNLLERFALPWAKWRHFIGTELEPEYHSEQMVVQGLNSARRLGDDLDWSRGGINAVQVDKVRAVMASAAACALRLVVIHHPFWLPEPHAHRDLIDGRDLALGAFHRAGVDLVLSGHIHVAFSTVVNGVIISHAGTGVSDRLIPGYANSFNVIRGDREQLSVQAMEWDGKQFVAAQPDYFARTDAGWIALGGQGNA